MFLLWQTTPANGHQFQPVNQCLSMPINEAPIHIHIRKGTPTKLIEAREANDLVVHFAGMGIAVTMVSWVLTFSQLNANKSGDGPTDESRDGPTNKLQWIENNNRH